MVGAKAFLFRHGSVGALNVEPVCPEKYGSPEYEYEEQVFLIFSGIHFFLVSRG